MIVSIAGKQLAFGMIWRRCLGRDGPQKEVAKIAKEYKSNLAWFSDRDLTVGVLASADTVSNGKDDLYSGAIGVALANGGGTKSTFFAYRLNDATFFVCGVERGRPKADFDVITSSLDDVVDRVIRFGQVCQGPFSIAGNIDGLRELLPEDRRAHVDVVPMDLSHIARAADRTAQLRKPGVTSSKAVPLLLIAIVVILILEHKQIHNLFPRLSFSFHKSALAVLTPQDQYNDVIKTRANDSVVPIAALGDWAEWWGRQPFVVGGWTQSKVLCKATTPDPLRPVPLSMTVSPLADAEPSGKHRAAVAFINCSFEFVPQEGSLSRPTNDTFMAAKPADWPEPIFSSDGKTITEQIAYKVSSPQTLHDILAKTVSVNSLSRELGTQLQRLDAISKSHAMPVLRPFLLPTGVAPSSVSNAYEAGQWSYDGPLRNYDILAALPAYVSLQSFTLTFNRTALPTLNDSKLELTLTGVAYARD